MSWLIKNIENSLNKLDQSAAVALNSDIDSKPATTERNWPSSISDDSYLIRSEVPSRTDSSQSLGSLRKPTGSPKPKKKSKEDALIDFLNEPSATKDYTSHRPHALNSTESSAVVMTTGRNPDPMEHFVSRSHSVSPPPPAYEARLEMNGGNDENFDEVGLLKKEISSLNQEISTLMQSKKREQIERRELERRCDEFQKQLSSADESVREFRSRDLDVTEALQAKDAQLGVLRVRLEEADASLRNRDQMLKELEVERNRILNDHTQSSEVQGAALESLKVKLSSLEQEVQLERRKDEENKKELAKYDSNIGEEKKALAEQVKLTEKRLLESKRHADELQKQLVSTRNHLQTSRNELSEYREKATRILQSKDKIITSLRSSNGDSSRSGEQGADLSIEVDQLRTENELLRDELRRTKLNVENMQAEIHELEGQMETENERLKGELREIQTDLDDEKSRREFGDQELVKKRRELEASQNELHRFRLSSQNEIKQYADRAEQLEKQLQHRSVPVSQMELEARVHSLTDNLIQKQTMIETLGTERNSLALQLERLEQQYKDMQGLPSRQTSSQNDDEVRQRLPLFFRERPHDTSVARGVKRAASLIDTFSVRLGVFLRRYPVARLFVAVYMGMLHLWVMIVLLTYQPEIHSDLNPPKPPPAR